MLLKGTNKIWTLVDGFSPPFLYRSIIISPPFRPHFAPGRRPRDFRPAVADGGLNGGETAGEMGGVLRYLVTAFHHRDTEARRRKKSHDKTLFDFSVPLCL